MTDPTPLPTDSESRAVVPPEPPALAEQPSAAPPVAREVPSAPLPAAPAPLTFAPGMAPGNTTAVLGFVLAVAGVLIPVALLTLAGGIISIVGLRRASFLRRAGVPTTGRGLALAGVIIGFGLTVLAIVVFVAVLVALGSAASQLQNINPADVF